MVSTNTIRTVKVSYVSEGADKFRRDADEAATAQTNLGQAAEQTATVTESSARRQLSAAAAYDKVRASVDAAYRSQIALERQTRIVDRAFQQGIIDTAAYDRVLGQLNTRFGAVAAGADKAAAAWRNLGAAGEAVSRMQTPVGRLSHLASDGSVPFRPGMGPGGAANQNGRLRPDQVQNLLYQGGDVLSSLGSGASLGMVAFQQGPQIAQIFAGPDGKSVKGAFSQASEAVGGFLTKIGPAGIAFGGVATAVGIATAALLSYRGAQDEVEKHLQGFGRLSGVTVTQINALADAQSGGGMSRRTTRDVASILAGNGRIGGETLAAGVAATRDFSAFLGVDRAEGATALADALGDVSKGAGDLASKYGLLNAATVESVQRMDAQGDRLGATRRLIDAIRDSTRGLAEETTGWGHLTEWVSNQWDSLGRAADKALTGGTLDERLNAAKERLDQARSESGSLMFEFGSGYSVQDEEKAVARLQKLVDARDETSRKLQANQSSQQFDATMRALNPASDAMKRLEDQAAAIRRPFLENWIDPHGAAKLALDGFAAVTAQMKADMAAGGAQYADAIRSAQFQQRTVGYAPLGRSAAQIDEAADNKRLEALRRSQYDTDNGAYENAMKSIETERLLQQQTLRSEATISETQRSGLLGRVPANLRQFYIDAAAETGVPLDFGIAVSRIESRFNPSANANLNDPRSHAYGLMQLQPGTAREMGVDLYDPRENVLGGFRYLRDRLRQSGGDEALAYGLYHDGPASSGNSAAARAAFAEIQRYRAMPTTGQQISEQDARTRQLRLEAEELRVVTEAGGRDTEAARARVEALKLVNDAQGRGIDVSKAFASQISMETSERQRIITSGRYFQFADNDRFARDQLGRDRIDQQAYAAARPFEGSQYETTVRDRARETINLTDTKSMMTDGVTSFVTDLRRGGDAATAFENALGNVADRLLAKVVDSTISSAFGGLTSGSGGGILGSIFGGAKADGGLLVGPGGPRSDNLLTLTSPGEYVINAASVSHYGSGLFDRLNSRSVRGYADGGLVAWAPPVAPAPASTTVTSASPPSITFVTPPGMAVEPEGPPQRRADGSYEQVLKSVESGLGSRAQNGRGPLRQAVSGAWARNG